MSITVLLDRVNRLFIGDNIGHILFGVFKREFVWDIVANSERVLKVVGELVRNVWVHFFAGLPDE